MKKISLDGTWKLFSFPERESPIRQPDDLEAHADAAVPCRVPGNVELDLVRAGKLPDPFYGDNIHLLAPYELHEWWYQRTFDAPPEAAHPTTELVFYGADCIATYWLNGENLGHSENALIEHRFDVTGRLLTDRPNTLTVRLGSPVLEALRHEYDPSMVAWDFGEDRLWLRKAPHSFGWDIMPRALSAGLWRSVALMVHDTHEIASLTFSTQALARDRATVSLHIEVETEPERLLGLHVRVRGRCGESDFDVMRPLRFKASTLTFDIPDPELWWPAGYGEPALYDTTVQLLSGGRGTGRAHDHVRHPYSGGGADRDHQPGNSRRVPISRQQRPNSV